MWYEKYRVDLSTVLPFKIPCEGFIIWDANENLLWCRVYDKYGRMGIYADVHVFTTREEAEVKLEQIKIDGIKELT